MQKIHFFFPETKFTVLDRRGLKEMVSRLFKLEGKEIESINYIFCTDEYLLGINQAYLNHNYYTDIISFDLSDSPHQITADIYISVDRVSENAQRLGISRQNELARVIFHGALHLCGYRDKSEKEKITMRSKEEKYLKLYFK